MEVNALGILICRIKENGIHSIIVHSVFIFLIKQHQYLRIFLDDWMGRSRHEHDYNDCDYFYMLIGI